MLTPRSIPRLAAWIVASLFAGLLSLGAAVDARAHLLNMSRVTTSFHADGRVDIDLALDLLLTLGSREAYYAASLIDHPLEDPQLDALLAPLAGAVELTVDGTPVSLSLKAVAFAPQSREAYLDPLNWPRARLQLQGEVRGPGSVQMRFSEAFRFEEPIANTFRDLARDKSQTRWLVTGQRSPVFMLAGAAKTGAGSPPQTPGPAQQASVEAEAGAVFLSLLIAGMRHIIPDGIDHLLFVAALLFTSASLAQLVAVITVFTLAHSLSLGLTALGWIAAPATIVEPLILLSIVWVAASGLRRRARRRENMLLVLFFGLVHGLGFAVALRELGLPPDHLLAGLAGFNVGVELAQLAVVALLALLLSAVDGRSGSRSDWCRRGLLAVIATTALLALLRFA